MRRHEMATGYLFITPFFVIFIAMVVLPIFYAAWASIFHTRLIGGSTFVGLANFRDVLTDSRFWAGVGRVLLYMAIQIPVTLGLALAFALAFDTGRVRGSRIVRLLMFLPNAVPAVVGVLMWGYIYGPEFGPINQLFSALGLPGPNLLGSDLILGSIVNIAFWGSLGYGMIILYAALQSIPRELYEAALLDGAGQFRMAWSIKIPAIRSSIFLCMILSVIAGFQLFNEPQLLASLAPGSISSDYTPNLYIYSQAFDANNLGYASAMSLIVGVFTVIVAVLTRDRSGAKS
jgi:multiple sugar transport system permease protein